MSTGAVAKTLRGFSRALEQTLAAEESARALGLLQGLDPRVKVVGMLALVVAAALARKLWVIAALLVLAIALATASRLNLGGLAKRVWLVAFAFTAMIAAPALVLTPGAALWRWGALTVTAPGARTALLLIARVETTVTLCALLVLTTPWMHLLKALRALLLPPEAIALLAMTHRYAVLLAETANQMFESRQSRMVGPLSGRRQRRLMTATGGVLLSKTLETAGEVHWAMQSRGFRGELRLLDEFRLRRRDYLAIAAFAVAVVAAVVAGH